MSEDEFVPVAQVSSVPVGTGCVIELEGRRPLALFNVNGEFFACDNECRHSGGPLGKGTLSPEGVVTCPWHQWQVDVKTGRCVGLHKETSIETHAVRVDGDTVLVKVK